MSALNWYPQPDYPVTAAPPNMTFDRAPPLFSGNKKEHASPYGGGGRTKPSPPTNASPATAKRAVKPAAASPRTTASTAFGGGRTGGRTTTGNGVSPKKPPVRSVPLSSLVAAFPQFTAPQPTASAAKTKRAGPASPVYSTGTGSGAAGLDDDLVSRLSGATPRAIDSRHALASAGDDGSSAAVREKVQNALKELDELKSALWNHKESASTLSSTATGTALGAASVAASPPHAHSHSHAHTHTGVHSPNAPSAGPLAAFINSTEKETRINLSRIQSLMKKLYQKNMELSQTVHSLREENLRLTKGTSSLSALRLASITSAAVVNAALAHASAAGSGAPPSTAGGSTDGVGRSREELLSLIANRDQSIQQLKNQHNSLRDRIDQFERERSFIYPPNYGIPFVPGTTTSASGSGSGSGAVADSKPTTDAKAAPQSPTAAASAAAAVAATTAGGKYANEYNDLYTELMDKIDAHVRIQPSVTAAGAGGTVQQQQLVITQLQNQLVLEASARRLERMCYNDQLLQLQQIASDEFVRRSTLEQKINQLQAAATAQ